MVGKEARTLRSKRHRALLWYVADGRCQRCQAPLPDAWHADHIVPWCQSQRTNVHEMQALCPQCNLLKGYTMPNKLQPRAFQRRIDQICKEMKSGVRPIEPLYVLVTPGGGKSSIPVILASHLIPQHADALCWVAPRKALVEQGAHACTSPTLHTLFPHHVVFRENNNEPDPCKGHTGYVATYDAILGNPDLHRREFDRRRYILFLDEAHHLRDSLVNPDALDLAWKRAIQPLIDRAAMVVIVSGTMERHDGRPIAFMPYARDDEGRIVAAPPDNQTITYLRQEALREGAIVPLYFEVYDGKASWIDGAGEPQERDSFDETTDESSAMLKAALATDYAYHLLDNIVAHWVAHKNTFLPAKLLVAAPDQLNARRYTTYLQRSHGLKARIAISAESQEALLAIKQFKGPSLDVLVTVGMAHEGLDVPEITHLACLTRYRSKPWLEQCFARACRTYEVEETGLVKRCGYIFAPDDPLFRQVIEKVKDDQARSGIAEEHPDEDEDPRRPRPPREDPSLIIPKQSASTESRAFDFSHGITRTETARLRYIMQKYGFAGGSPLQFKAMVEEYGRSAPTPAPPLAPPLRPLTPLEQEKALRDQITEYVGRVDYYCFHGEYGRTNRELRIAGFPPRKQLTIEELTRQLRFLQTRYPAHLFEDSLEEVS